MNGELTWYITRTSGLLGWVLLAVATVWGILLATRLLERRPSPAWLLDLHRYLGTLTLTLTVIHVVALVVDDFVEFTVLEVLVPFTSDVDRFGVGYGVLALHLLLLVQISSWIRGWLSLSIWRGIHLLSAPLFLLVCVHALMVGTDIANPLVVVVAVILLAEVVLVTGLRVVRWRRERARPAQAPRRRAVLD